LRLWGAFIQIPFNPFDGIFLIIFYAGSRSCRKNFFKSEHIFLVGLPQVPLVFVIEPNQPSH
jgi:hypothetical protein